MTNPILTSRFTDETAPETPNAVRMTVEGVAAKTAILVALVFGTGTLFYVLARYWSQAPSWFWALFIATSVFAIVLSFQPKWALWGAPVYAVAEGTIVGTLSGLIDNALGGLAAQALTGTALVFAVMLLLYRAGWAKADGTFVRFLFGAGIAGFIYFAISYVVSWVGGSSLAWFFSPAAMVAGLGLIGLAAGFLVLDFKAIDAAITAGESEDYEWFAAFGLVVTLVWIYLEILRVLFYLAAYAGVALE